MKKLSQKAKDIHSQISKPNTKLGDIRKIAQQIKKDHSLAIELWQINEFFPRQLAILIIDKKYLTEELINKLTSDIEKHDNPEKTQLIDWLMANQISKNKETILLMESWQDSSFALQRRLFWYHQARLRWMGKPPPPNTKELLAIIEKNIDNEKPEVQWAMNFTAGWIGIYEKQYRKRCIKIGEKSQLYKDEKVSRGCTPNYLPEFINIEVKKRKLD